MEILTDIPSDIPLHDLKKKLLHRATTMKMTVNRRPAAANKRTEQEFDRNRGGQPTFMVGEEFFVTQPSLGAQPDKDAEMAATATLQQADVTLNKIVQGTGSAREYHQDQSRRIPEHRVN